MRSAKKIVANKNVIVKKQNAVDFDDHYGTLILDHISNLESLNSKQATIYAEYSKEEQKLLNNLRKKYGLNQIEKSIETAQARIDDLSEEVLTSMEAGQKSKVFSLADITKKASYSYKGAFEEACPSEIERNEILKNHNNNEGVYVRTLSLGGETLVSKEVTTLEDDACVKAKVVKLKK